MTRINCVPVTELSGPHLVAEYRELPRVYALARKAYERGESPDGHPTRYVLGPGHVRFFYSRLLYVRGRHRQLIKEMLRRGYKPNLTEVPSMDDLPDGWHRPWHPKSRDLRINRERIKERS